MEAKALTEIIKTRMACGDGNPTEKSLFYEIIKALEELELRRSLDIGYRPDKKDGSC